VIYKITEPINSTNSYVLYDENNERALLIDACDFLRIDDFMIQNRLSIDHVILTHEHCDHIFGLEQLREKYHASVIASNSCSSGIQNCLANMSKIYESYLFFSGRDNTVTIEPFVCKEAEITFSERIQFEWNNHSIYVEETPGHSKGSSSIVLDGIYLFSGDSLSIDYKVITKLPNGSEIKYKEKSLPFYQGLPDSTIVFPGHGRNFLIGEIMRENYE
jgi:hydroxyacylglutathione hydrolase